ncbi:interleukin-13 receptor subunit alpha-1-like isoform X3 [Cheilinus undulatus]|uniref:interleukin-13 receptor subunit alpha-1-like isoform X3 n=1 Tax=Cheilinus undulatus TaxID=241271 RepID=UPI001BD440CA|nr:interleukin-13 receptor subunit alpha-1-like isoform X3 [Cheilinus undulatus]
MFKSVDLVCLCCLFLVVECLAGIIQPPQNLSLSWSSDFWPQLNWTSPPHSMENCSYEVESPEGWQNTVNTTFWTKFRVMEGGKLKLSVRTVCGQEESDWVSVTTPYPDLVENFTCSLESSQLTYCTWNKANNTQDIWFYYQLFDELSRDKTPLTECSSYRCSEGIKTGCDLKATTTQTMNILLNGTVDNEPVRNTFSSLLKKNEPRPLNWTVTKDNNEFVIHWSPPDINDGWTWTYKIKYTKCNEENERRQTGGMSLRLDIVPQCPYRMQIKATLDYSLNGIETPWSEFKDFDAETDPNAMLYAVIIIPLIVAGLVLFIFMCCRKNKDKIFPKIPEPRDLLSDISDNNNKSTLHNLYIPAEEEDTCRITLVMDPHTEKNIS